MSDLIEPETECFQTAADWLRQRATEGVDVSFRDDLLTSAGLLESAADIIKAQHRALIEVLASRAS